MMQSIETNSGSQVERATHVTERQNQVLKLLVLGRTNKEMAEELRCSPRTIEFHLRALFRRFRVANRTALVAHTLGLNGSNPSDG